LISKNWGKAMYEFEYEIKRKEKIYKNYIILYMISALINLSLFLIDGEILRGICSFLFVLIILNFGLRKKAWAIWIIKYMVWINIIALIIILFAKGIELMQ